MASSQDALQSIARWLDEMAAGRGISAHTRTAYERDLLDFNRFLSVHFAKDVALADYAALAPRDLRAFMAKLQRDGAGAATRNRKLSAIKTYLRYLHEQHGFDNEALIMARGPRKPERLPRPLSMQEASAAVDEAGEIDARPWVQARDTALITLLYSTGLRISEALSIAKSQTPLEPALRIRGKGNKVRQVPVLPIAVEAVDRYLDILPFDLKADDPIFRGIRGGVFSARQAASLMQQLRVRLGLPASATPHALRHSFATHLLSAGGDIRAIQELLGHASLSATQIYTKIDEAKILDVYRAAHPKGKS